LRTVGYGFNLLLGLHTVVKIIVVLRIQSAYHSLAIVFDFIHCFGTPTDCVNVTSELVFMRLDLRGIFPLECVIVSEIRAVHAELFKVGYTRAIFFGTLMRDVLVHVNALIINSEVIRLIGVQSRTIFNPSI